MAGIQPTILGAARISAAGAIVAQSGLLTAAGITASGAGVYTFDISGAAGNLQNLAPTESVEILVTPEGAAGASVHAVVTRTSDSVFVVNTYTLTIAAPPVIAAANAAFSVVLVQHTPQAGV